MEFTQEWYSQHLEREDSDLSHLHWRGKGEMHAQQRAPDVESGILDSIAKVKIALEKLSETPSFRMLPSKVFS